MSSRKSRLSLSKDLHKDKDVKTPNARRALARTSKTKNSPETQKNEECYEVSPSQGSDYSPLVSLTQDNSFHAINGVSWEWNSPQRLRDQQQLKIATTNNYRNHKPPLRTNYADIPDTAPTKKPTGFNKFISKLNLLMEKENVADPLNSPITEPTEHSELPDESFAIDEFFVESGSKQSEAIAKTEESDDDIFQEHAIESPVEKSAPTGTDLDDSKLDNLLIEASQTMEQHFNKPSSPPPPPQPELDFGPKVETKAPHLNIPIEMNDSDMDGFLIQASLMVEEKLSDSSQDSCSNGSAQQTVNRPGVVASIPGPTFPPKAVDKRDIKGSACSSEGTSETTMSQDELKALIEMKRQEALRRLQNNRLKRGMKGTNSHG